LEEDIQEIDRKIDTRVYRLYDLQPAEIALVEEQVIGPSWLYTLCTYLT
jgi:hypothetical protein